ncbi:MAG: hypothetical protein JW828_00600 [Sedimentisphaerales bacterium]|nr:hypothetical protein [Sedimentisphaerales bacterium]
MIRFESDYVQRALCLSMTSIGKMILLLEAILEGTDDPDVRYTLEQVVQQERQNIDRLEPLVTSAIGHSI